MAFDPRPATLSCGPVTLQPLAPAHAHDLFAAAQSDAIWRYLPLPRPADVAAVQAMIADAVAARDAGREVPFAIVTGGRAVGSTRFLDIQRQHRGLEIGWTWLGEAWHRSAVNTACKLALLAHAFDDLGAIRVSFKTDARNLTSQRAIERLGAVREGTWRKHRIQRDGDTRDTVYYSIVDDEWPTVRARLRDLLATAAR